MATEELYKVSIVGLHRDKEKLLDALQEQGFMHIDTFEEVANDHELQRDRPTDRLNGIVERLLELEWMDEHLGRYRKAPLPEWPGRTLAEAMKDAKKLSRTLHKQLQKLIDTYNGNQDELQELDGKLALLRTIPFPLPKGFEAPLIGSHTLTYVLEDPEGVAFPENVTVLREGPLCCVQATLEDSVLVDRTIQEHGLRQVTVPKLEESKETVIASAEKRIAAMRKENAAIEKELKKLARMHYGDIVRLKFELTIFHDRHEAANNFLRTEHAFVTSGYAPVSSLPALRRIGKRTKAHVLVEGVSEGPSKLRNLPYVRHFEFITKMFGLPSYGRIDPTLYISFFLPLFFGFMFADVGYGILLVLSAWYLWIRSSERLPILKDSAVVLFVCSFTTILFGVLFGSFFGSLIPITPLLFDPFANAKWVLVTSLAIGLFHLNVGILTGIYEQARAANLKEILLRYVSVLSLQAGAASLLLGYTTPGWILLGFSVALFVIKSSLMGLMDITGFVGTWFSYARLLALSLATGGIALGVNIIAEQLNAFGLLGPILFILFAVLGHLFNFALNVLGSAIHSVRLHYIEFFSQWYEGQGSPFRAFTTARAKETI